MTISGFPTDDTQAGTTGDDVFDFSQGGNDTLSGLDGNDTFNMGAALTALDAIDGGPGNDTLVLNGNYSGGVVFSATTLVNVETVNLTAGPSNFYNLTLNAATLTAGQRMVINGPGNTNAMQIDASAVAGGLNIVNSAGADAIIGGSGNDTIVSRGGNDIIDGGGGRNRLAFAGLTLTGVTVDLSAIGAQNTGHGAMTLSNIQDLNGTNFTDTLIGDGNANTIQGNGGNDTISGGGGNDLIVIGGLSVWSGSSPSLPTDAHADGGSGNDTLSFYTVPRSVTLPGPQTVTLGNTGVTFDLSNTGTQASELGAIIQSNFENLQGTAFDDTLTGDGGDNILYGADGSDDLNGGAGNDTLYGDKLLSINATLASQGFDLAPTLIDATIGDDDFLRGGAGDDVLDGGAGNNAALYDDATGDVTLNLTIAGPQAVGGGLGSDTLISIQNLLGGDYDDQLTGDGSNNVLIGGKGNDTLIGGGGNDALYGGNYLTQAPDSVAGHDVLIGGAGDDTLVGTNFAGSTAIASYVDAAGAVTVSLGVAGPQAVGGGLGNDTLTNITGLIGSDYDDTLTGNPGDNTLDGGAGNDTLDISDGGNDIVNAGSGNDYITVRGALTASDAIDGGAGNDTVVLNPFSPLAYINGLTFSATTMVNVENLYLVGGPYDITTDNATVAAGQTLTVQTSLVGSFGLIFNGSAETDGRFEIWDSFGNDVLTGGGGNDTFNMQGGGDDVVNGGAGTDIAVFLGDLAQYQVSESNGTFTVSGVGGADTLTGVEFAQFADQTIALMTDNFTGTAGNDTLTGNNNDNLFDFSVAPGGTDVAYGLGGTDTAKFAGKASDANAIAWFADGLTATDGMETITLHGIEFVQFDDVTLALGTGGNDVMGPVAGATGYGAGWGNDTITPGAGTFTIFGGDGTDTVVLGGNRADWTLSYAPDQAAVLSTAGSSVTLEDVETVQFDDGILILGTPDGDVLAGSAGDDYLIGGKGNDTLNGGAGVDTAIFSGNRDQYTIDLSGPITVSGPDGVDTLNNIEYAQFADGTVHFTSGSYTGTSGGDSQTGTLFDDQFNYGQGGNDTLSGLGGNDSFNLGNVFTAADAIDGGAGNDTLNLSGDYSGGVTFSATTLVNVETITLAAGNSYSLTTNDATVAFGQILTIDGSALGAADVLTFNGSAETNGKFIITGGAGNDVLTGGAGDDVLTGGGGNDSFTLARGGNDTATGGSGNDLFVIRGGNDIISGNGGRDRLVISSITQGASVNLNLQGQAQNTGLGSLTLSGIQDIGGSTFADVLSGDGNDNTILGNGGNDVISGGGGNDLISVGGLGLLPALPFTAGLPSNAVADGGNGSDTLSFYTALQSITVPGSPPTVVTLNVGVTVDLSNTGAQATGLGTITQSNFENLQGTRFDDNLTGDGGDNILYGADGSDDLSGGAGNDTLYGDKLLSVGANQASQGYALTPTLVDAAVGGDDFLRGGAGDDVLDGGVGNNAALYDDATGDVTVNLTIAGPQAVGGGLGSDTLISIQNLLGGDYNDQLTGDGSNNILVGGKGNDTLIGGAGNDALYGGNYLTQAPDSIAGHDVLIGGAGDDTLVGTNFAGSTAVASYADANGAVTVSLAVSGPQAVGGGLGNDTLTNITGLIGSAYNDVLTGDGNDNVFTGGAGNDTIIGGAGTDTAIFSGNLAQYQISSNNSAVTISGPDGTDTLTGVELAQFADQTIALAGGSFTGTSGNDSRSGTNFDDQFNYGQGGNDTLSGVGGDDTFSMGSTFTSADVIDGGAGYDTLSLSGNYTVGVVLSGTTLVNVEAISLAAGNNYKLTTNDATVAAGATLAINALQLGAGNALTFIGSAETDGKFDIWGGAGNDALTGGAGDDTFYISGGGNDTVVGGNGNDWINAGGALTAADRIDGGAGNDTVELTSATTVVLGATTLVNVETLYLLGNNLNITTNNATVGAGQTLTVDAGTMAFGKGLTFNGAAETDGRFAILGSFNDDVLTGGAGNDSFDISRGGNDTVVGGNGNDTIIAGWALTAADAIDGGAGSDTLQLTSTSVVLGATTLVNVETLSLASGTYSITTNDATVASGATLTVDGTALGAADSLTFNGSAETNGKFAITGGAGNDVLTGGAGNDTLTGGDGADVIDISRGGNDTVLGGNGDDTIYAGLALTAADAINGGAGNDTLVLDGSALATASSTVVLGAATLTNVETLLLRNSAFTITTNNATVAAGQTLTVDASLLGAGNNGVGPAYTLTFNGSAETDGNFVITGFNGNDVLTGGAGNDALNGLGGNDTLNIASGGNDVVNAGYGDDTIVAGGALTAADAIDGGDGNDTITLAATTIVLSANTLVNVETMTLANGMYNITTNDATVAAGQTLTVNGSSLGSANILTFNGSAETNGNFVITGGAGNDVLTGGAGNDTLNGAGGTDTFDISRGGNDTVVGGNGNDTIIAGGALTAADAIDGGAGTDSISLTATSVVLGATTLLNVESLSLAGGTYNITTNDATVASGATLTVDGSALWAADVLTFNGSAETNGKFVVTGGAGNDVLTGGVGNDTLNGGSGNDVFDISAGGSDIVSAGDGNDTINVGLALTSADRIDGGTGNDTVVLDGISLANASTTVMLGATTMVNVETLLLRNGAYAITTNNATVAAGQTLTVDGSFLGAGNQGLGPAYSLTFNGAAETDGNFVIKGFTGHDTLTGGAGNDIFDISFGGSDTVSGGAGNDTILAGNQMSTTTTINGGAGNDTLSLDGYYAGAQALNFTATTMVNVETITLAIGGSYSLTTNDATVASGATLTVDGSALGAADVLTFNGVAETNGSVTIIGGAGADILAGGRRGDTLTGGAGADTFKYTGAVYSTGVTYDTITDFDATSDVFWIPTAVNAVDAPVVTGALSSGATFNANLTAAVAGHLAAHDAVLFTGNSGSLSGHTFLVVDANGTAGYQANADYVMDLTFGANLGSLTAANFHT